MCGEKAKGGKLEYDDSGSPPRVRGKELRRHRQPVVVRITPACAGKSVPYMPSLIYDQDHPRVCGEKYPHKIQVPCQLGSPPRVRGKVDDSNRNCPKRRITPACAWKRYATKNNYFKTGDHPRVCGEKVHSPKSIRLFTGSPPRVRGKVTVTDDSTGKDRITPACAGKSVTSP